MDTTLTTQYDAERVSRIRAELQDRLIPEEKVFYIESVAEAGISEKNVDKLQTQDIDRLGRFFVSTKASTEYQANVFAAMISHMPDYLVSYLANSDYDNDGVTFAEELRLGTNPSIPDTPYRAYTAPVREVDNGMEL